MINFSASLITKPWPRYARILHWHERYGRSYIAQRRIEENNPNLHKGAGGDPAVFQLNQSSSDRPVKLTRNLQLWWYGLLRESANYTLTESELKASWRNLTNDKKAFNNKMGIAHGYRDYILGENPDGEDMKLALTIANGATVKVLGPKIRRGGEDVYPIEIMDARDPKTLTRTLENAWWMIFAATNSTVEPAPKGNVDPFPYSRDYDVVVPLLGYGTVGYVEAGWIDFLPLHTNKRQYPYYRTWISESVWNSRQK